VIVGAIKLRNWYNDGGRYAAALAEQIGVSPQTAQKYAHLTLSSSSEYACINMAAEGYSTLCESKYTVQVSGVTIPQWVIYAAETNNALTDIVYYDYRQLHKYGNGTQTSAHIAADGVTVGMDPETVQQYIGFAPLCRAYDGTGMEEAYKYYYKDKNTGDTVSYVLTVRYEDDKAVSVTEKENYFILSVLTLPE
jgi:hypothetical protein